MTEINTMLFLIVLLLLIMARDNAVMVYDDGGTKPGKLNRVLWFFVWLIITLDGLSTACDLIVSILKHWK